MAIIKFINNKVSLKKTLDYICKEEKTDKKDKVKNKEDSKKSKQKPIKNVENLKKDEEKTDKDEVN